MMTHESVKSLSCRWAMLSLLITSLACSGSSPTTPNQGASGGIQSEGGAAGSAGQNSGGAGESGSSAGEGGGGVGGQGVDAAKLCADSCGLLKDCSNVDPKECEEQCIKEVSGEGYLIQEIGQDFYKTLGEDPKKILADYKETDRCYWHNAYWQKWSASAEPANKYETLKEQDVLAECVQKGLQCDGESDKGTHTMYCIRQYYRYNVALREKIKACYSLSCWDKSPCVTSLQIWESLFFPTKPE